MKRSSVHTGGPSTAKSYAVQQLNWQNSPGSACPSQACMIAMLLVHEGKGCKRCKDMAGVQLRLHCSFHACC